MNRRSFLKNVGLVAGGWMASRFVMAGDGLPKPNIVFILADDLGWTDTATYGNPFYETPNISRLAAEGMRFTNAYAACPVCSPTRASIMTGKYPARLHLTNWIGGARKTDQRLLEPDWTPYLPLEEVTIAEQFKAAGYVTGLVGKWHLGEKTYAPSAQGFDTVLGLGQGQPSTYLSPYNNPNLTDGPPGEYLTDRLTTEAEHFLEANSRKPFLLYLAHHAVHSPFQGKPELVEKYKKKPATGKKPDPVYAAMIESLDYSVGRIMGKLDELGIAKNTVVVFMSDNGGLKGNAPLRGSKGTLYEGGIREPLIVRWPGVVKAGSQSDAVVSSVDFLPTLLEMAGEKPVAPVDGISFLPALQQTSEMKRDAIYWHYPHYHWGPPGGAIRAGDWKLIEFYEDGKTELYNLKEDQSEKNDLSASQPEKAAELRARLEAWRESVGAQMPTPNPAYEPGKDKGKDQNKKDEDTKA